MKQVDFEQLKEEIKDVRLTNLDEVLVKHTSLYDSVTETLPELRDAVTERKDELTKLHAKLYTTIKADAARTGAKVTENSVEAEIQQNPIYLEAVEEFRVARLKLGEADQCKELILQREWSVRALIQLYMGQYWGISSAKDRQVVSDNVAAEQVKRSLTGEPPTKRTGVSGKRTKATRTFKRA